MSKICQITGKKAMIGNNVSHSKRRTKRTFDVNLFTKKFYYVEQDCWIESDDPEELEAFKKRKYQYMAKDRDGRDVFLADSGYVLQMAQMDFKHIKFHFTSEF